MAAEKYPIGIQTFSEIIEGGYTYVDKTGFIPKLVNEGKYYFLSRPRRFGKSLLLSTLHAYFDGRRELFKGLALDTADVDWTPAPVLHFDLNSENFKDENGLVNLLDRLLENYETAYDVSERNTTISGRLERLIKAAYDWSGRKVVILVDEYDKPLLGIEDNIVLFEKNQAILKGFFGNLKSMDRYIRFALLTGVARFNKVSIFSDLNNLNDISLNNEFADICGWTERELLESFPDGIRALAEEHAESFENTVAILRCYYDGYLFAEKGHRLYNPFSVLKAFYDKCIEPYWFESGTPTFLAKRVKSSGIMLPELNGQQRTRRELLQVGMGTGNPVGLMFQTGYLTIESYDSIRQRYKLRFPNREVEIGFAEYLYQLYVPQGEDVGSPFNMDRFQDDLYDGNPDGFMKRLQTLCKDVPYESQTEAGYRNIVWLLGTLCGTDTLAERHSYKGRSDLEIKTPGYIYVFEFKYDGSVESAMSQLHGRDYAGHYALERRKVYLIGANFSSGKDDRGLTGWQIEELKR
ncbi:MAG: ATP-binding protein [Muribaculaceae bacterium]|nr:ATP-binding protein [Muribaculaceae bacterium]